MPRFSNESSLIVSMNPKSSIAESYRLLRTKIQFSFKDQESRTVMVTSSQGGEGKTTTISNLAIAYAQEGKKVLLIDADLRKPSLHRIFPQLNHQGLSSLLTGHCSIQDAVQPTDFEHLDLLPSGPVPGNPSELIDSAAMHQLLQQLKQQYDVLLVDTPAVLAASDAVIVGSICDGVIMVAAPGKVRKEHLKKAREQLEHVHARMLGVVMNRVV
ncbi:CpsD/CapB family tyrosine-protein kinase [Paenibacillus sp. F411]|uniref:CpsD/CapB family tyrosine-protein kinase n=1 Tax=Paenibacillus TaxID=44249 RepID=UPI0010FF1BA2|nr:MULTISPECIES: CpsD/CapB family tyrosine-protein kinase [Paenibacillus]MBO2943800.1 CpsD/CapB family tyrosine-protein kinase [Paenibacillus sp. F411]